MALALCIRIMIERQIRRDGLGFPGGASGKEPACHCSRHKRCRFDTCVRKIPWRRPRQPTPVFLPGESHGQRSLVGYSPQGCKESDTTEATSHAHTLALMNLNQYSKIFPGDTCTFKFENSCSRSHTKYTIQYSY